MSYDICVGREWVNYTRNGNALFYDHMPAVEGESDRGGLWTLDGQTGAQASKLIANAFDRIADTRLKLWQENDVGETRFRALYDSPNGWGSTIGGLLFLARIQALCIRNPRAKVSVSA